MGVVSTRRISFLQIRSVWYGVLSSVLSRSVFTHDIPQENLDPYNRMRYFVTFTLRSITLGDVSVPALALSMAGYIYF